MSQFTKEIHQMTVKDKQANECRKYLDRPIYLHEIRVQSLMKTFPLDLRKIENYNTDRVYHTYLIHTLVCRSKNPCLSFVPVIPYGVPELLAVQLTLYSLYSTIINIVYRIIYLLIFHIKLVYASYKKNHII